MSNYNKTDSNEQNKQEKSKVWAEPVDGSELFTELTNTYSRYLALQKYQPEALALWTIFSHCYDAFSIAPKLLIHSPEKRCGKTTLLDVLSEVVWKPLFASNITTAVLYRAIEGIGGTVMIDEADTFIHGNSDLAGIINSGHRKKGATVLRCDGDKYEIKEFSTWAPTVISMIGKPRDTILDRSIIITMRRKTDDEKIERFIHHKAEPELQILSQKIARWAEDNFSLLSVSDPIMPKGLNDRAEDNWRPLLSISQLIGEECFSISKEAAINLSLKDIDEENASTPSLLLSDIYDAFEIENNNRISTEKLLKHLLDMDNRPWGEWNRGRAITASQIAKHLRAFHIQPKKMRWGDATIRGYEREQFEDAFTRYLAGTLEKRKCSVVPPVEGVPFISNNAVYLDASIFD